MYMYIYVYSSPLQIVARTGVNNGALSWDVWRQLRGMAISGCVCLFIVRSSGEVDDDDDDDVFEWFVFVVGVYICCGVHYKTNLSMFIQH